MALPERITVKISSEAAGSISFAPVVRQELAAPEFLETILRVTGKDAVRVREVLRQGTVVSGASRFRWEAIEAAPDEVRQALQAFPDPQPDRPFDPSRCVRVRFGGGRAPIDLERSAASRKRLFRRRSFWQALLDAAARSTVSYHSYSYAERADVYRAEVSAETARLLRQESRLLPYSSLAAAVRESAWRILEFWVER